MIRRELHMETTKTDERYFSVKIMRSLPLSEQIHQANGLVCNEAAEGESVFLEGSETRNGHIHLLFRLGRRENGKKR
jgi:hypothetical protein